MNETNKEFGELIPENSPLETQHLHLNENGKRDLKSTAGWSMFLSIAGIIGALFLLGISIIFLIIGPLFSEFQDFDFLTNGMDGLSMPFTLMGILYLLFAVLYFFPSYFLLLFSTRSKKAIYENNQSKLDEAFKNLKRTFKFFGIMMIISLVISFILIPVLIFGYILAAPL